MYQVFISSTQKDLAETRLEVQQALLRGFRYLPVGMENFRAAGLTPWEVIKEQIDTSDFFVLIIGGKYGSINPETGLSYTREEYQYALNRNIPILPFIRDRDCLLNKDCEENEKNRKRLNDFIDAVCKNHHVVFWKDTADLELSIIQSLGAELERLVQIGNAPVGWVRADEAIVAKMPTETTMKFYNVHALVKGTVEDCERGTALITYTGSALVDSPDRPVIYEDRVKTKFGIVSHRFFPAEQLIDEDEFRRNPIQLDYKIAAKSADELLYFTGEIVAHCQLSSEKGGLALHIPYFAENVTFFLDVSSVPFVRDYGGKAYVSRKGDDRIVHNFNEAEVIFNPQNLTYAITARNVPADSNIVFVWNNR